MGRARKKIEKKNFRDDMSSFIDVIFLLLIFFMLMPFKTNDYKIENHLPRDGQKPNPSIDKVEDKIEINLKRNGEKLSSFSNQGVSIKINGRSCSVTQILPRLRDLAAALKGGVTVPVEIQPGRDVPFYFVMRVIDAAKLNDFTRIRFSAVQ